MILIMRISHDKEVGIERGTWMEVGKKLKKMIGIGITSGPNFSYIYLDGGTVSDASVI